MPRGIYQRKPRLQLITDQRKESKTRQFKFPARYIEPITGKVIRCRVIHTFPYANRYGSVEMCVIAVADAPQHPALSEVDTFLTVPKFRVNTRE